MARFLPLAFANLLLATAGSAQSTWYVDVAALPPGNGSQAAPYASLQFAIDQPSTVNGDTLLVATGVYAESIDLRGKALVVDGSTANPAPVLDGSSTATVVVCRSGEGPTTVLRGLVVRNGLATVAGSQGRGGGAWLDGTSPTFESVRFEANTATLGGGVAVRGGAPSFLGCDFVANTAAEQGGALHVESGAVSLQGGQLRENRAALTGSVPGRGGALCVGVGATAVVVGATFELNRASTNGHGGAVAALAGSLGTSLTDSIFFGNTTSVWASQGQAGAVRGEGPLDALRCTFTKNGAASPVGELDGQHQGGAGRGGTYTDCLFQGNSAQNGGALFEAIAIDCEFRQNDACADGSGRGGAVRACQLTRCLLVDNSCCGWGGGAYESTLVDCEVISNRCTGGSSVYGGQGGGVYGGSATGCIIRGNSVSPSGQESRGGGAFGAALTRCFVTSNHADIGGGVHGSGSVDRCTIVGNWANQAGGGVAVVGLGASLFVRNSIVWRNFGSVSSGNVVFRYSAVEGGAAGLGNIGLDPQLLGPAGSDPHIAAGSPCIDAGDPVAPLDPDGSPADMGSTPFDPTWSAVAAPYCLVSRPSNYPAPECLPEISGQGLASVSGASTVQVIGTAINPGRIGILLIGRSATRVNLASAPIYPTRTLCIGAPYVRGRVQAATTGGPCGGVLSQPIPSATLALLGAVPGDRLHAQYWFRDASSGGAAMTNALEIPVVP